MPRKNVIQFSVEVVDKASKSIESIQSKLNSFVASITKKLSGLATMVSSKVAAAFKILAKKIGTVVTAIAGMYLTLNQLTDRLTKAYSEMDKLSDKTGFTVEQLSLLKFTGDRVGISLESLAGTFVRVQRNITTAAEGSGETAKAFRDLNISASALNKVPIDVQMTSLAHAFSKLEDGTQKTAIALRIFGPQYREVLNAFKGGLPAIREYSAELQKLGGEVTKNITEKSRKFQESLLNIKTAFIGIKNAVVNSGLVTGMTALNNAIARFLKLVSRQKGPEDYVRNIRQGLLDLQELIRIRRDFEKQDPNNRQVLSAEQILSGPAGTEVQDRLRESIFELNNITQHWVSEQSVILQTADKDWEAVFEGYKLRRLDDIKDVREYLARTDEMLREAIARNDAISKIVRQTNTPSENFLLDMKVARDLQLPEELFEKYRSYLLDKMFPEIQDKAKNTFDFMEAAAEQAAGNMQSAFADFFFDPFEEGVKGLLKGFLDAMRRMFAEIMAFNVMKGFGIASFFTKMTGLDTAASGGTRSGMTLVGEQGPELVNLPRGSHVLNNSATKAKLRGGGGEASFTTNIDARGADPGLIARLPQILEQRDRQLMVAVERYFNTGTMPL